jgi:hypothetical protein
MQRFKKMLDSTSTPFSLQSTLAFRRKLRAEADLYDRNPTLGTNQILVNGFKQMHTDMGQLHQDLVQLSHKKQTNNVAAPSTEAGSSKNPI